MTRASRDETTRSEEEREYTWKPSSNLPNPEPMDGWRFKWVRKIVLGDVDQMNMAKRRREGWEPVLPEDQPKLKAFSDSPDHIEIGGLVLCKAPEGLMRKRDEYFARKAKQQQDGLSGQFRSDAQEDARMPLIEERVTKTSNQPL